MTTSHAPVLSVSRMKPRRCARQVYSTVAFISRATSSAILFSNPSSLRFEKGRLLGSAQTRSTPGGRACCACCGVRCGVGRCAPPAHEVNAEAINRVTSNAADGSGERKDIERAPLRRVVRQVGRGADHAERGGRVALVKPGGDDGPRPAADA